MFLCVKATNNQCPENNKCRQLDNIFFMASCCTILLCEGFKIRNQLSRSLSDGEQKKSRMSETAKTC